MREKGICEEDGCDRPAERRGLCTRDYQRRKRSDPSFIKQIRGNDYARFWSYVQKGGPNECWEWSGGLMDGYGVLRIRNKNVLAHRYSFTIANGYHPDGRVLHSCDNPPCVNPLHLREGTPADNSADMVARSRQARGANNGNAKLTDTQVADIHKCYERGLTQRVIAVRFGVSQSTVSGILLGRSRGKGSKIPGGKRNWAHRPIGPLNPNAKLSALQNQEIICRFTYGESANDLAKEFGVATSTIYRLRTRI